MNKFLEIYQLPKLTQEEINNPDSLISTKNLRPRWLNIHQIKTIQENYITVSLMNIDVKIFSKNLKN